MLDCLITYLTVADEICSRSSKYLANQKMCSPKYVIDSTIPLGQKKWSISRENLTIQALLWGDT
jgi:hypothetical protein